MFCPHCGKKIEEGQVFCHACGGKIEQPSPAELQQERPAWELRQEMGFFKGLMLTMKESLFSPTAFFRKMPVSGGLTDPTLYAMITAMAGTTMLGIWQMLFQDSMPVSIPGDVKASGSGTPGGLAVLAPFFILATLYLWAGMLHGILLMVRGVKYGFEASFRAAAYSYGPLVFLAVPFCGWPIAVVWSMVMAIIGLKEAQSTTGGKSAFAVLFPIIFCCSVAALFSMLLFGTIAASFGTMTHYPWK